MATLGIGAATSYSYYRLSYTLSLEDNAASVEMDAAATAAETGAGDYLTVWLQQQ